MAGGPAGAKWRSVARIEEVLPQKASVFNRTGQRKAGGRDFAKIFRGPHFLLAKTGRRP